jgi:hypothetical protein
MKIKMKSTLSQLKRKGEGRKRGAVVQGVGAKGKEK